MQEAAYGATLLLLLLNGARKSGKTEIMMQITCPKCGRLYPEDAAECPGCKTPNEKFTSNDTVLCPNKLCGKEVSNQFEKCPFCGTPLHNTAVSSGNKPNRPKAKYVERSGWYTYATIMLVLSIIALVILTILSLSEENAIFIIIGLGEFILFSLFCGIVQLLAGIKQGIDNLQNK